MFTNVTRTYEPRVPLDPRLYPRALDAGHLDP
jgi:hypothetical protein